MDFMKTNKMMTVNFGGHTMGIEHLTGIGNLTELWAIGNAYREKRGLAPLDLNNWLRRPQTDEFVRVIEYNLNLDNTGDSKCVDSTYLEVIENTKKSRGQVATLKSPLIVTKKGRYGGTWAHLYLLIDAATYLDAQFKFEVYETFITHKLLEWRDSSGDNFKSLNLAIDAYLPEREGKDNKGVYIQIALAIKRKILPDGDDWNTATPAQLEKRTQIEQHLITILRIGLIRDYAHMKEVVAKL
jgi:hypothetical protein